MDIDSERGYIKTTEMGVSSSKNAPTNMLSTMINSKPRMSMMNSDSKVVKKDKNQLHSLLNNYNT